MYSSLLTSLILTYFTNKLNLRFITIFNCWNDYGNMKLLKLLSENTMYANIFNLNYEINETIVNKIKLNNYSSMGIFLQYDCPNSANIINWCAKEKCYSQKYHWLMYDSNDFDRESGSSTLLEQLNHTLLCIDAEISYADFRGFKLDEDNSMEIPLLDVYNNGYHIGGKLNVTFDRFFQLNANGTGSLGESQMRIKTKYDNRIDMSDVTMRVGTVHQTENNVVLTKSEDIIKHLLIDTDRKDPLNRIAFQMIIHLRDILKYNVTYVHHDKWTVTDNAGGAIGSALEERTDITTCPFVQNEVRLKYMDAMLELFPLRSVFTFRTYGSQQQLLVVDVLLKPFNYTIWICLIVFIIITSFCLKFVYNYENSKNRLGLKRFIPGWYLTFITTLGAFCQQGSEIIPTSIRGRAIIIMMYATSLIVYNYYTTEVLSSLIGNPVTTNIKTLFHLADSSLAIGIDPTTYTMNYLNVTKTAAITHLYEKKIKPNWNSSSLFIKPREGLDRMRRGGYAYHCEGITAYDIIGDTFDPVELCDLNEIYLRPKMDLSYFTNKQSPYKELFKGKLRKFRDAGIRSKFVRKWIRQKPPCTASSFVFSVGMEYTGALFMFLIIAITLSLIILIIEIVHYKYLLKYRKHKIQELPATRQFLN